MLLNAITPQKELKTFKTFNRLYILALSVIALISIFSQVLIQMHLSNQANDAHVINFAAKLRTYSQSLTKLALLLERGEDLETNRRDFNNTLKQWQSLHTGLLKGSDFLNLRKNDREELKEMYNVVQEPYEEIVHAANQLSYQLAGNKPLDLSKTRPFINRILANEKAYLLTMDLIVFDYDRFSRNNLYKLKTIEYWLLGILLLMLFLEALLIFYPLSKHIREIIGGLTESETHAHALARELQQVNLSLESSNKELHETSLALERATYLVKTDAQGKILYANDKYCHVTKYNMRELIGKPLFYNSFGEDESIVYEHIRDPERQKDVWQGEVFDRASDGTGFWLDVTLMPIINNKGRLYQYLIVSNDVTKRKNTEQELQHLMQEQLRIKSMEQKIKSYSIIAGQEKERKRVAAEIHDGIGQMLTSMRMRLEMLESKRPDVQVEMTGVNTLLKSIIDETRRICSDLLPSVLGDFGLKAAVTELLKNVEEEANIVINFDEEINPQFLTKEIEMGVYRIVQESLNNVVKHAHTESLEVSLCNNREKLILSLSDYGRGFNFEEEQLYVQDMTKKNNGLRIMKERAEMIGGELTIESRKEEGTTVHLEVAL